MDAEYANYYTREVMLILIREFQSPDEEMKKIVLKVSELLSGKPNTLLSKHLGKVAFFVPVKTQPTPHRNLIVLKCLASNNLFKILAFQLIIHVFTK